MTFLLRQNQLLKKGWWVLMKLVMEFAFNVTKLAIWARNCSRLDCLIVCYMPWTCRTQRKVTDELSKRGDGPSKFLFHRKKLPDILQDTEESNWWTLPVQGKTIPFFMEKSARYYGPVGWRWMAQHYKRTLGDWPGSKMSLSIRVLKVAYNVLSVYLDNISF